MTTSLVPRPVTPRASRRSVAARQSSRPLALVLSKPAVLKVFQITGYDERFSIYPSLGAAVEGSGNGHA